MSMSRKDYERIAAAIKASLIMSDEHVKSRQWRAAQVLMARRIAATLAEDNAQFDSVRFLSACGITAADTERQG